MKKTVTDYIFIAVGCFILSFSINFFLVPMKISTGGISGIATVLYYLLNIPMSVTSLVINLILFLLGFRFLTKSSIVKNLAGILLLSLFLQLTKGIGSYREDMMICAIFGGILVGVGVGLPVLREASTGGSDFAALMLNRIMPHVGIATFILVIDSLVILFSGFAFENVTIMFYSVLSLYISTKVADFILIRGDFAKSVYIISEKNEEISEFIISDMVRGVTGIYSKGCYTGEDAMMLMCIVKSKEVHNILNKIKSLDKNAFIIISDVREVCGDGFKAIG